MWRMFWHFQSSYFLSEYVQITSFDVCFNCWIFSCWFLCAGTAQCVLPEFITRLTTNFEAKNTEGPNRADATGVSNVRAVSPMSVLGILSWKKYFWREIPYITDILSFYQLKTHQKSSLKLRNQLVFICSLFIGLLSSYHSDINLSFFSKSFAFEPLKQKKPCIQWNIKTKLKQANELQAAPEGAQDD